MDSVQRMYYVCCWRFKYVRASDTITNVFSIFSLTAIFFSLTCFGFGFGEEKQIFSFLKEFLNVYEYDRLVACRCVRARVAVHQPVHVHIFLQQIIARKRWDASVCVCVRCVCDVCVCATMCCENHNANGYVGE